MGLNVKAYALSLPSGPIEPAFHFLIKLTNKADDHSEQKLLSHRPGKGQNCSGICESCPLLDAQQVHNQVAAAFASAFKNLGLSDARGCLKPKISLTMPFSLNTNKFKP